MIAIENHHSSSLLRLSLSLSLQHRPIFMYNKQGFVFESEWSCVIAIIVNAYLVTILQRTIFVRNSVKGRFFLISLSCTRMFRKTSVLLLKIFSLHRNSVFIIFLLFYRWKWKSWRMTFAKTLI